MKRSSRIFIIAILAIGVLSSLFMLRIEAAPNTRYEIGTSTKQWLTNDPFARKGFYDDDSLYLFYFYYNGSWYGYKSSPDGATWSSFTAMKEAQGGAYSLEGDHCIAVRWTQTGDKHIDWVYANGGNSMPFLYRRGTLSGSPPTISWDTERTIKQTTNWGFSIPNVISDANGYPWAVAACGGQPTPHARVWKGGVNGTSWDAGTQLPTSEGRCMEFAELANGYMYVVEGQHGRPDHLWGWLDDGDNIGWTNPPEDIVADIYRQESFSVVSIGNNVEVVYLRNATNVFKVCHRTRTWGSGWGTETLLEDAKSAQSAPTLSATGTSDLRMFFFYQNDLCYKSREGGSWGLSSKPFGEGDSWDNPNPEGYFLNSFPTAIGGGVVGVAWREGSSSPYKAKFGYVGIPAIYLDFSSNPEININFTINGTSYITPQVDISKDSAAYTFIATHQKQVGSTLYTFDHWRINDTTNYYTESITLTTGANTTFLIFYSSEEQPLEQYQVAVSSVPELNVRFNVDDQDKITPISFLVFSGSHTFVCLDLEIQSGDYKYQFDYWKKEGTKYYSLTITISITANTSLQIYYKSVQAAPETPSISGTVLTATWFMRSDVHTIHGILGYKLLTTNTVTYASDSRVTPPPNASSTYGVRVWAIDYLNYTYELTSGEPAIICTRYEDGEGFQNGTWSCPVFNRLVSAVKISIYHRFNLETWSLRVIFITKNELFIKFPAATWTFTFLTKKWVVGGTNTVIYWGSSVYASRIQFSYYKASPWDIALARLIYGNYFAFFTTPWTYYLGDLFYAVVVLFGVITACNRVGSLKPVLALLWIFGGAGGILDLMIPALTLHIAWLLLAAAFAFTLFKLFYGSR